MLQLQLGWSLKSTLYFSTKIILSQLQTSRRVGWKSNGGWSQSWLSSSFRIALEIYFILLASLKTKQQESIFLSPPLTILDSRTEYFPPLLIRTIIMSQYISILKSRNLTIFRFLPTRKYRNYCCFVFEKQILIILIALMSASLPRIKNIQEIQNPPQPKFRKLTLNSDNQQQRKASLKTLKTERLKSLSRYSTVQEQKEYKNEKIHLNLIERKLLNGTYDEKKQTSHQLNSLKQKRDHFKVETALKTREVDRLKRLLQEVKDQIAEMISCRDLAEKKVSEAKEKYECQVAQTETARQNQAVLEHMLKMRQEININLSKRKNELQSHFDHLRSLGGLIEKELRQLNDRVKVRQTNLEDLIQKALNDRKERNQLISKHQQRILKRKEDQILHSQRSKQYLAQLDQLQIANELKEFNSIYEKILANIFMSNFCRSNLLSLHQKYESYEYAYRKIYSYRSFDPEHPHTLVDRFLEHSSQQTQRELMIKEKESFIEKLSQKKERLKLQLIVAQHQLMQSSEKMTQSQVSLEKSYHLQLIAAIDQERKSYDETSERVRQHLVRLLNQLKKKGDRRSNSKNQAAAKNMQILSETILQLAKDN